MLETVARAATSAPGCEEHRLHETFFRTAHVAYRFRLRGVQGLPASGPLLLLIERPPSHTWQPLAALRALAAERPDLRMLAAPSVGEPAVDLASARPTLSTPEALAHLRAGHAVLGCVEPTDADWLAASDLALASGARVALVHLSAEPAAEPAGDTDPCCQGDTPSPSRWVLEAHLATVISAECLRRFSSPAERREYLRWRRHAVEQRSRCAERPALPSRKLADLVLARSAERIQREVEQLTTEELLLDAGDCLVAIAKAERIPHTLHEIGRLRELAFRSAGEGTGQSIDLDRFDEDYLHLFVYSHREQALLGAYRVGPTDDIVARHGARGLYTSTLFEYGPGVLDSLAPALELGRSFVRPESQRTTRTLLLLWKGLARFVARRPRYRTLFGPVSISASYQPFSRDLIIRVLSQEEHLHPLAAFLRPKNPVCHRSFGDGGLGDAGSVLTLPEHLSSVVADAESDGKGLPVLLSEYLKLGGKFLGFNLDPDFSGVTDGLVVVDLCRTDRRLLEFYMGAEGLRAFSAHHATEPLEAIA